MSIYNLPPPSYDSIFPEQNVLDILEQNPFDIPEQNPFDIPEQNPFDIPKQNPFDILEQNPFDIPEQNHFDEAIISCDDVIYVDDSRGDVYIYDNDNDSIEISCFFCHLESISISTIENNSYATCEKCQNEDSIKMVSNGCLHCYGKNSLYNTGFGLIECSMCTNITLAKPLYYKITHILE
jgi:hypothetical protein